MSLFTDDSHVTRIPRDARSLIFFAARDVTESILAIICVRRRSGAAASLRLHFVVVVVVAAAAAAPAAAAREAHFGRFDFERLAAAPLSRRVVGPLHTVELQCRIRID